MVGLERTDVPTSEWVEVYGVFRADQVTRSPTKICPCCARSAASRRTTSRCSCGIPACRRAFSSASTPDRCVNEAGEVTGGVAVVRDLSQVVAAREAFVSGRLEVVVRFANDPRHGRRSERAGDGRRSAAERRRRYRRGPPCDLASNRTKNGARRSRAWTRQQPSGRSAPAGPPRRPSPSTRGSPAPRRTRATWCSTRAAAARPPWSPPSAAAAAGSASTSITPFVRGPRGGGVGAEPLQLRPPVLAL